MPRVGLSTEAVVAAAAQQLDADPRAELSLSRLASEARVKAPSLYNHVSSLDDLRRRVALVGIEELGETLRTAVMGRSGADAITALAHAYRAYATAHPGVYPLTQEARPNDPEYAAAGLRAIEPVVATLRGCGIPEPQLIHRVRTVRSSLHGFVLLESSAGFGLDVDVDASFDDLVAMVATTAGAGV